MSSCGSVAMHDRKYFLHHEDFYWNFTHNEINSPEKCNFLNEFLLLISEYNKQRKNISFRKNGQLEIVGSDYLLPWLYSVLTCAYGTYMLDRIVMKMSTHTKTELQAI